MEGGPWTKITERLLNAYSIVDSSAGCLRSVILFNPLENTLRKLFTNEKLRLRALQWLSKITVLAKLALSTVFSESKAYIISPAPCKQRSSMFSNSKPRP